MALQMYDDAVRFALVAHAEMVRKDGTPYILHPLEVACIASTMTNDDEVLCAAVLHDVVEDTDYTLDDIVDAFGARVGELVESETEDKRPDLPSSATWRERKEESLAVLRDTEDRDVLVLWLSDKLSNMRSFARMYQKQGKDLWKAFNQSDPVQQAWYYRTVADATHDLSETLAWQEFASLLETVFEGVASYG